MKRQGRVIGVDGLGYVGLATALAFAERGWKVVGYDINRDVRNAVRAGRSPFKVGDFAPSIARVRRRGALVVVDSVAELVRAADGVFVCLPTPQGRDGRINLAFVKQGVAELGRALLTQRGYRVIVVKSTVVPGTTSEVIEPALRKLARKDTAALGVAANPEFLSQGSALHDSMRPERIVIGTTDQRAARWLREVYAPFPAPVFQLTPSGAELVKYSSNAFLAMKVSFANEVSRLAEKLGTNIDDVMLAVGSDSRIGQKFLRAGPGFGGSCLEKDIRALIARAEELGVTLRLEEATLLANEEQAVHAVNLIRQAAGNLEGRTIAFLGVAFKAGTDDVRESRAFPIVQALVREGAHVRIHDPLALENFRREWAHLGLAGWDSVTICESVQSALLGVDIWVIHSSHKPYKSLTSLRVTKARRLTVVDLRRESELSASLPNGARLIALGAADPSRS